MIVRHLRLENVRNIESAELALGAGVNLLVGPNGAGKTAVLEAIHLLVRRRSFRTVRTGEVIRHDCERLGVAVEGRDSALGELRIGSLHHRNGRVELRRNGERVRQASSLAALLPVQLMLPSLPELVFGGPSERRQWLDWGAFHVKHDYGQTLRRYQRALRQRNAALRRAAAAEGARDDVLSVWTERLGRLGESVSRARESYLEEVVTEVNACLGALAPELAIDLELVPGWNGEDLVQELGANLLRDVKSGATGIGPHRADVVIRSGSAAAASVLSRGQGKIVASALRIGQAMNLAARGGVPREAGAGREPGAGRETLFLIDDVGAELDQTYGERFFELLDRMGSQIVATTVRQDGSFPGGGAVFHVKQGTISRA